MPPTPLFRRRHLKNVLVPLALSGLPLLTLATPLSVTPEGTLETRGFGVLVFNNAYDGLFSDAKMSGIELLLREERIATNGDVRLQPTPGQWDAAPQIVGRHIDPASGRVEATLTYPNHGFTYRIRAESLAEGVRLQVVSDQPLPSALVGKAGLNLEFLPSAYVRQSYQIDGAPRLFPLHPSSDMATGPDGIAHPLPLAEGQRITLAPESPHRRVVVEAAQGRLALYDGRDQAQNGWFVVRTLLPEGRTGILAEWTVSHTADPQWLRPPVIAHSQVGYYPTQPKLALIELDRLDTALQSVRLAKINEDGSRKIVLTAQPQDRGAYLRYHYKEFDFSEIREPGLYQLSYGETLTAPFRISEDVYATSWQPTLDVYLPVAMDHLAVKEGHRMWHGYSHADDARQAPVNHVHFDLYAQGPTTDTPFQPGEHIPGLNIGGWLDAGDFDVRTQTQYHLVQNLVRLWEDFRVERDQTTVSQLERQVFLHRPDGVPDLLQQIEHGTLFLVSHFRVFGRAINGIVEPDLGQYTHIGDAATKTDGRIFDPKLKSHEINGTHSGRPDDRWAFTSRSTPLNYGAIAALAAASRALKDYRPELAAECLAFAQKGWAQEQSQPPALFHHGNTTGGELNQEQFTAAVELYLTTREDVYAKRIVELWQVLKAGFPRVGVLALRVAPLLDASFQASVKSEALAFRDREQPPEWVNPFGVPITTGGWAGSSMVTNTALLRLALHQAYPEEFSAAPIFHAVDYHFGRHPGSDISLVSGVGTISKEVAYGSNRADFSYIPGGIVPGILILKPNFPENKEDWPHLWGQNEYVVNHAGTYLYMIHAVDRLLKSKR